MTTLSYCTTCRNRLWQLEQTLASNLSQLDDGMEICLVDYGSSDGLSAWVWRHFEADIAQGRLVFFELTHEVPWNSSRAKNLAHRIARGDYLFSLDADNFITRADIEGHWGARAAKHPCHQFSGDWPDGSCGRIGVPREVFFQVGGYDEGMLPMGGQDMDLLRRVAASGHRFVRLPPPGRPAVQNTMQDKLSQVQPTEAADRARAVYDLMNGLNLARTRFRLEHLGPVLQDGFASFRGRLNGQAVVIDGFNQVRAETA